MQKREKRFHSVLAVVALLLLITFVSATYMTYAGRWFGEKVYDEGTVTIDRPYTLKVLGEDDDKLLLPGNYNFEDFGYKTPDALGIVSFDFSTIISDSAGRTFDLVLTIAAFNITWDIATGYPEIDVATINKLLNFINDADFFDAQMEQWDYDIAIWNYENRLYQDYLLLKDQYDLDVIAKSDYDQAVIDYNNWLTDCASYITGPLASWNTDYANEEALYPLATVPELADIMAAWEVLNPKPLDPATDPEQIVADPDLGGGAGAEDPGTPTPPTAVTDPGPAPVAPVPGAIVLSTADLEVLAILDAVYSDWQDDFAGALSDLVFDFPTRAAFLAEFFQVKVDIGATTGTWVPLVEGMVLDGGLGDGDDEDYVISFRASDLLPFSLQDRVLDFVITLVDVTP